ncbi:MAG: nitrophenyl compound nitroreductase subunit ArsF family protein [Candidatus Omnitrophota bacterium]|jgi:hypothetical protein
MKPMGAVFVRSALALAICFSFGTPPAPAEETSSGGAVTAYYFHGTFRCPTCNKMEQYAKEAIEKDFKSELDSGKLVFQSVNVETAGNEHFVKDYQLYTKTLILSMAGNGSEVRSKNLDKIWEYVRDKERYQNYVRDELGAFMKVAS